MDIVIASAGNTLAPALACLTSMGYRVSRIGASDSTYQAEREGCRLIGKDTLELLGLAALFNQRGIGWMPSDAEVQALLKLEDSDA